MGLCCGLLRPMLNISKTITTKSITIVSRNRLSGKVIYPDWKNLSAGESGIVAKSPATATGAVVFTMLASGVFEEFNASSLSKYAPLAFCLAA